MSLQRYGKQLNAPPLEMVPNASGAWVKAEDVQLLEKQYSCAMREVGRFRAEADNLHRQLRTLQQKKTFSIP